MSKRTQGRHRGPGLMRRIFCLHRNLSCGNSRDCKGDHFCPDCGMTGAQT